MSNNPAELTPPGQSQAESSLGTPLAVQPAQSTSSAQTLSAQTQRTIQTPLASSNTNSKTVGQSSTNKRSTILHEYIRRTNPQYQKFIIKFGWHHLSKEEIYETICSRLKVHEVDQDLIGTELTYEAYEQWSLVTIEKMQMVPMEQTFQLILTYPARFKLMQFDSLRATTEKLLCHRYKTSNGIYFRVDPDTRPVFDPLSIALITFGPDIKTVDAFDIRDYWVQFFVESNMPVPTYFGPELVKIGGIWQIYYLYDKRKTGQQSPAHDLKTKSAYFHVESEFTGCFYCRQLESMAMGHSTALDHARAKGRKSHS